MYLREIWSENSRESKIDSIFSIHGSTLSSQQKNSGQTWPASVINTRILQCCKVGSFERNVATLPIVSRNLLYHQGEHSVIIFWLGNAFPRGKKKRSVNTSATQTECDRKRGTRRILVAPLRNREMGVCRLYRQEFMLFSPLNEISLQPLYESFAIPR